MKKFYYLMTLMAVFVLPALVGAMYLGDRIIPGQLVSFIVLVTIIGSIWDVWATRHGKRDSIWLWDFNKKQTLGITFLGLPIEEYAFYVVSSTYVVIMWETLKLIVETGAIEVIELLAALSLWTLAAVLLPFSLGGKRDKLIN